MLPGNFRSNVVWTNKMKIPSQCSIIFNRDSFVYLSTAFVLGKTFSLYVYVLCIGTNVWWLTQEMNKHRQMLNALLTGNGSYTLKRFTLFVPTLPPITFLEQTFNSSNMSLGTVKLFAFNSSLGKILCTLMNLW